MKLAAGKVTKGHVALPGLVRRGAIKCGYPYSLAALAALAGTGRHGQAPYIM